MSHQVNVIGAPLVFEHDNSVLLGLRAVGALYMVSTWQVPASHVEFVSPHRYAVGEAAEELDVDIREEYLELVHTVHLLDAGDHQPRMQLLFRVHRWQNAPKVNEPDDCGDLGWFPRHARREPLVDDTRPALEGIATGRTYTEMGWTH
ncbi:NUDIX domain-containing protein [Streptomyces nigrescens]|uniref:NUDIX domain-containing protein n=1 Tax=Streptomyces nigrescens TaxID=1920 RepID=A0ABY7IYF0_STRNI|nr:NUDIX domain-containing protein [Streptomyces nigrescens]WAU04006.1 NUDIX domain-containing protein [Streptomyces nigrescens]